LHGDPFGFWASAGQLPAPSQVSAASHWPAAVRHTTVVAAKLVRHVPVPSQVSAPLQTVLVGSPHAVPLALKPLARQLPAPSHVSAASHWPPADRQTTVFAATFVLHEPAPSQVSAPLQSVFVGSPQAVPLALKPFAGQLPAPSHVSATSHWPLADRQTTVF